MASYVNKIEQHQENFKGGKEEKEIDSEPESPPEDGESDIDVNQSDESDQESNPTDCSKQDKDETKCQGDKSDGFERTDLDPIEIDENKNYICDVVLNAD